MTIIVAGPGRAGLERTRLDRTGPGARRGPAGRRVREPGAGAGLPVGGAGRVSRGARSGP